MKSTTRRRFDQASVTVCDSMEPSWASRVGVQGLTISLWLWAWLPQMIDLLKIGRQYPGLGSVAQRSATAGTAYVAIVIAIGACAILLVAIAIAKGLPMAAGMTLTLLAPWVLLNGTYVINGGRNNEVLLFPLAILAYALHCRSIVSAYGSIRFLTVLTAASSLVLGLVSPHLFLSDPLRQAANEKAVIGDLLLNGLFPTANQLGISLAIGLPVVLLAAGSKTRWPAVAVIATAIVWASSRTAIVTAVVTCLIYFATARANWKVARDVMGVATIGAGALVLAAPFVLSDPTKLSGRVAIWRTGLEFVQEGNLLRGGGAMVFRDVSPVTMAIGSVTGTGHNMFVTIVTVGGIPALLACIGLWATYLVRSFGRFPLDRIPLASILVVTTLAIDEDPLRAFVVAPSAFLLAPLLAMPLMLGVAAQAPAINSPRRPVVGDHTLNGGRVGSAANRG